MNQALQDSLRSMPDAEHAGAVKAAAAELNRLVVWARSVGLRVDLGVEDLAGWGTVATVGVSRPL